MEAGAVQLHTGLCELLDRNDLATTGVMLIPRAGASADWDTTLVRVEGDLELTDEGVAQHRQIGSRTTMSPAPALRDARGRPDSETCGTVFASPGTPQSHRSSPPG